MKLILSIALLGIFGEIVWRQLKQLRQPVNLAIVCVQFIEIDCFRVICIDILEDCFDFIATQRGIKPLENLLELLNSQLPAFVCIVSIKGLVKGQLL